MWKRQVVKTVEAKMVGTMEVDATAAANPMMPSNCSLSQSSHKDACDASHPVYVACPA